MTKGPTFAPFFQRLIDDPAKALETLRARTVEFEEHLLTEERGMLSADAVIPAHDAVGVILFDAASRRVPLSGPAWLPAVETFEELVPNASASGQLVSVRDPEGRALCAVWATVTEAASWNLIKAVRARVAHHPRGHLVLVAGGAISEGPLSAARRAFALTDLEGRVLEAVIATGSGRRAAARLDIAYATVRETLARATRRMGVPNLPAAVHAIVAAAFGVLPEEGNAAAVLADMLPISERQAIAATLIAAGLRREEVAEATGASLSVIRKDLETVYTTLGLSSAADLARFIVEVRALRLLARSTESTLGYLDHTIEPTRLTPRPTGDGTIAWSDHGPRSGRPILIVHSNWCCRAVPGPLVKALQAEGFRPIAIDRPGFGATSLGRSTIADPFSQAVADTLTILQVLDVERIPIIARCGAQFVVEFARAAADRVGKVILVSPTPPTEEAGLRLGIAGVIKEAFYRSPRLISFFFRTISAQISLERVETLTRAIVKGSPTDEALCADPSFLRDRLRAIRPLSTGSMTGAIHEEYAISRRTYRLKPLPTENWIVVQGGMDTHNHAEEVFTYWKGILPTAQFHVLSNGGRFITSSHADFIVSLVR